MEDTLDHFVGAKDTLPSLYREGDAIPHDLVGAEILQFGASNLPDLEGGGLTVQYRLKDGSVSEATFEFTELGMWLNRHVCIGA